jgi:hypothetical protein
MKALLPNVTYFSADVIPNKDILRNAHEVWIQTQYISHAAFYRIVGETPNGYRKKILSAKQQKK